MSRRESLAPIAAAIGGVVLACGASLFLSAYAADGLEILEFVLLILFLTGLAWLAWPFATAVIGVWLSATGRAARARVPAAIRTRTALLLPIYNENAAEVLGRLGRMLDALEADGAEAAFSAFVLSDTNNPARRAEEERAVASFLRDRRARPGGAEVYYRHRADNVGHKAGNIADWVTRWGGAYDFMVVLDADSLMSAGALTGLVRRMQARDDLGLLQTAPILIGSETLFGRFVQFASAAYSPTFVRGLSRVQGRDGVYWGHNAIIRVRAFAALCGLPTLPGKPPFGGTILSHDFVEGALLRRGGYAVEIAPDLHGSYEETPPNLAVYAKRDRRWAQGNVQHLRLLAAPGFSLPARFNLALGAFGYLASPIWLLFLVTAATHAWMDARRPSAYFPEDGALFPIWNAQPGPAATWLIALVVGVLALPRLLSVAWLASRPEARWFGGPFAVVASWLVELVLSSLLAPVLMCLQTKTIVEILSGRDSGWSATAREDGGVPLVEALRLGAWPMAFGAALGAAAVTTNVTAMIWIAPIAIPLLLAPGLIALSGSRVAGRLLARAGLLLTPSELAPEPILRAPALSAAAPR